jgi:hypothetical protein
VINYARFCAKSKWKKQAARLCFYNGKQPPSARIINGDKIV